VGDEIRVETEGLTRFSGQVHTDVSRTIEPGYYDAKVSLAQGVQFGAANASGSVHAAKVRYAESLSASTTNILAYMDAARVLADAAAKVAVAFDGSDARSAQTTDQVNQAMWTAAEEARRQREAVDGHPTTRKDGRAL
jgi:hypothetical protein